MDSGSSDDPLIGATIDGRFAIERSIGVGGMGTVYRAKQLSVGRDVAVKVLRAELTGKEVALERFFREAKTISQLTHPNIVRLIDFGQDREFDVLYLVMELVSGTNLGDLLRQGRLRVALALEVAYQVCGALTEPHAAGVIHRDLKPDNLLLMPVSDGTIQTKVLDFGIARALETNETTLTATGMICGTPAYMAPEQAQNEALDPRTDLYALGVILYEMLSGWPPFSGTSSLQIMLKHIQEMPVRLRDLLPPATLPEQVEELVYQLMHKDRDERPKSAREVRDRIDDLRRAFDFGRVRVEHAGQIDEFVMRKLPRGKDGKSGPTELLRRETGIEQMLTDHHTDARENDAPAGFARDTVDEMDHHTTFPFTPDEKGEVRADARVKISTKGGAQQAWTPGDQPALDKIKNTEKNFADADADVDAFGATAAHDGTPVAGMPASEPRRTMVESRDDSEAFMPDRPLHHTDQRPIAAATDTGERRPVDTSDSRLAAPTADKGLSFPLVLATAMTLFVVGAAVLVILELRSLNGQDGEAGTDPAEAAAKSETTTGPAPAPSMVPGRDDAMVLAASRGAHAIATSRDVADDIGDALEASSAISKKGTTSKTPTVSAQKPPRDTKESATNKKPAGDKPAGEKTSGSSGSRLHDLIKKKGLTNE
jgi:serine/threonine protein kinase